MASGPEERGAQRGRGGCLVGGGEEIHGLGAEDGGVGVLGPGDDARVGGVGLRECGGHAGDGEGQEDSGERGRETFVSVAVGGNY